MQEFQLARKNAPRRDEVKSPPPLTGDNGTQAASAISCAAQPVGPMAAPKALKLPNGKPVITHFQSDSAIPHLSGAQPKLSLAEKRGIALPGGLPVSPASPTPQPNSMSASTRKRPGLKLSQISGGSAPQQESDETKPTGGTMMDKYAEFLDPKTGTLKFKGKAVLNSQGVQFASGSSYSISLDEVETMDELGKGNYGTVFKVRHSRPKFRREGQGLAGNKYTALNRSTDEPRSPTQSSATNSQDSSPTSATSLASGTGIVMAMKEIRLELDDSKFAAIIMELDILHRCLSPYIIDFYGAFFQEGAVYICMEFMDGGSIDKLYGDGIPESVLRKITYSTTVGLKSLKDDHNIIHRDVKPTNILVNTRGQVKICDFGVSGNLVASFAKTNIGCQSYMAPERISGGGVQMAGANPGGGTYSVQSDIWSLGLTIIECAMGRYPYPPETYNNIFSQLSVGDPDFDDGRICLEDRIEAKKVKFLFKILIILQAIVDGEPPDLPEQGFSVAARSFVKGCLDKEPKRRPTYAMLLQHEWLKPLSKPTTITEEDEEEDEEESTPATESEDSFVGEIIEVTEITSESPEKTESEMSKSLRLSDNVVDVEVAEWVLQAIEKRKLGKLGNATKPALHAAPLDVVASPVHERSRFHDDSSVSSAPE